MLSDFTRLQIRHQCYKKIPSNPGIYQFLSDNKQILYIGASSNLKRRVAQHLVNKKTDERRHRAMITQSTFVEYRCFASTKEAFDAEETEIWVQQPPFNRRGVYNGAFSYLVVRNLPHPHVICFRGENYDQISNNDIFFRINLHSQQLIRLLRIIRKRIPLCFHTANSLTRSCWENQLGLCVNQCRNENTSEEGIDELLKILSGNKNPFLTELEDALAKSVHNLEFEEANRIMVLLNAIKTIQSKFRGQGSLREVDQFICEQSSSRIPFFRIKIEPPQNECGFSSNQLINFGTLAIASHEDNLFTYLKAFYLKLNAPPKRIKIVAPPSVISVEQLKHFFLPWLKRYFLKVIPVSIERLKMINSQEN